jgi:hypothetical protein
VVARCRVDIVIFYERSEKFHSPAEEARRTCGLLAI